MSCLTHVMFSAKKGSVYTIWPLHSTFHAGPKPFLVRSLPSDASGRWRLTIFRFRYRNGIVVKVRTR
eukprot:3203636-Prorocentrum_lima.AAC.1